MNFDRGDLNAQKTGISGTPVREEDFSLDPTGNWTDYVQKTSGTTDLDQDHTHNKVNEITAITAAVGDDSTDPGIPETRYRFWQDGQVLSSPCNLNRGPTQTHRRDRPTGRVCAERSAE